MKLQEKKALLLSATVLPEKEMTRFALNLLSKHLLLILKIIAPWRSDKWTIDSREAEIEYCKAHGIDLPFSVDSQLQP